MNCEEVLSSSSIFKVIACWEQARRRRGFDEIIGIEIMTTLFEMNPQAKSQFGFRPDQLVDKKNGLQRIGILIHGQRFIQMLDCLFSMLGPDEDCTEDILKDFNKESCEEGMPLHQFVLLLSALLAVMASMLGDEWTNDLQLSWIHVMRYLQGTISKIVATSMPQKQIAKPLKSVAPISRKESQRSIVNVLSLNI